MGGEAEWGVFGEQRVRRGGEGGSGGFGLPWSPVGFCFCFALLVKVGHVLAEGRAFGKES